MSAVLTQAEERCCSAQSQPELSDWTVGKYLKKNWPTRLKFGRKKQTKNHSFLKVVHRDDVGCFSSLAGENCQGVGNRRAVRIPAQIPH